jgi:hypothetical protein
MQPDARALAAWSGLELLEPLARGARNQVFLAARGGRRLVVRRSGRPAASLAWSSTCWSTCARAASRFPRWCRPRRPPAGRRPAGAAVPAEPAPRDRGDWRRVVEVLRAVHRLTAGWPQRPGFASARELLAHDRGGDVRLDAMPADAVAAVHAAWWPILDGPECAVHADVGGGNVLVDGRAVALLDWDEARVDVSWFDFAHLPEEVEVPSPTDRATLVTAGVAWEAATCWVVEPAYAARRLAEPFTRLGHTGGARGGLAYPM